MSERIRTMKQKIVIKIYLRREEGGTKFRTAGIKL